MPQNGLHLTPLPADLVLVLLHAHIGVHALAADQLKAGVLPIRLLDLHAVKYGKVLARVPALGSVMQLDGRQ